MIVMHMDIVISGQVVTVEEKIDLGLFLNAEMRLAWFAPGELMQYTCRVAGLKLWVAHYTKWDEYRVAFGERPMALSECEPMDAETAVQRVMVEVMNVQ